MSASDFIVNSQIRSVLARHWIDLQKIKFGCFKGTVRLSGELLPLGSRSAKDFETSMMEKLEMDLRRIRGVIRVYYDLINWCKTDGQWECVEKSSSKGTVAKGVEDAAPLELDFVKEKDIENKSKK